MFSVLAMLIVKKFDDVCREKYRAVMKFLVDVVREGNLNFIKTRKEKFLSEKKREKVFPPMRTVSDLGGKQLSSK